MVAKVYQHALNVGQFDRNKLHRVDLERMRLAAERQTNMLCDAVGPAWGRAGTEFLNATKGSARGRLLAFDAGLQDGFILECTDSVLRVIDADTDELVTRVAVGSSVNNGDFAAAGTWTLASTSGQSTAISGNKLTMKARAHGGLAKAKQTVTTSDVGVEHAIRVVVDNGPVDFRLGSTDGGAEYLPDGEPASLETGTHSIAFTPTASPYYVELSTESQVNIIVSSCQIEGAGVLELPTPWPLAALPFLRVEQSLDVMYVGCSGLQPMMIERRGDHSWGIRKYKFFDGPFLAVRTADVKLTPSVTEGNGTLSSDKPFFKASHVGALFRIFHEGQKIETYLAGDGEFTPAFLVSGITETNVEDRKWTVAISGTWAGTLRHQHSYDGENGRYTAYRREQAVSTIDITANATYTNDDNDDNIDVYYRMGFEAGTYTSGEAAIAFNYPGGGGFGICRVTGYTSPTQVSIEVIKPFMGKHGTKDWREGQWSDARGWPSAPVMHDGRLTWVGSDQFAGSVSDAFYTFDEEVDGDAGPILRSIALGGRNEARWGLSLNTLMIGCDARIVGARASSLDEILTPDNFGLKSAGKIGAAPISPLELADDRALFVQNSGNTLYEITWSSEKGRYVTSPFSKLTADMFAGGILGGAVQTLPDQRIWIAVDDSDAVCVVFEPSQQVLAAHVPISTSRTGEHFLDFAVLPGVDQDRVYTIVERVINGNTVHYVERFAKDTEARVRDICKVMDAHVVFGAGSATITGLDHLEGEDVVVWMDGAPVTDDAIVDPELDNSMTFTVAGGQITLPSVPTIGGCAGLAYDYQFKSARLAYGVEGATSMLNRKSIAAVGMLLGDYCRSGVRYGTTNKAAEFNANQSLPRMSSNTGDEAEEIVAGPGDDEEPINPGSQISFDERICIAGRSPKPLGVLGIVLAVETHSA